MEGNSSQLEIGPGGLFERPLLACSPLSIFPTVGSGSSCIVYMIYVVVPSFFFNSFILTFVIVSFFFGFFSSAFLGIFFSSVGDLQEMEVTVVTKAEVGVTLEIGGILNDEHTELLSTITCTGGPSQPVSPQQHDPSCFRL